MGIRRCSSDGEGSSGARGRGTAGSRGCGGSGDGDPRMLRRRGSAARSGRRSGRGGRQEGRLGRTRKLSHSERMKRRRAEPSRRKLETEPQRRTEASPSDFTRGYVDGIGVHPIFDPGLRRPRCQNWAGPHGVGCRVQIDIYYRRTPILRSERFRHVNLLQILRSLRNLDCLFD